MSKLKMKTTATLLIILFLTSILSVALVRATPTVDDVEWLPPLTSHDEFGFKDGSTLPIKFRLLDGNDYVMDEPDVTVNEILFSDSFEDASAWTPSLGTWNIEDGVYSQDDDSIGLGPQRSLAGDSSWTDYSVEVNAKGIEGYHPSHGSHTWVGLAFRAQDPTHFYEYYFRTTVPDIIVVKNDGGDRTTVSGPVSFTCANGNWYKLKVIAEGNSFRFFVDDVEISGLAFTDDSFPNGNAGVLVFYGSHAHFDDFKVDKKWTTFSLGSGLETQQYKLFSDGFEDDTVGNDPSKWNIDQAAYVDVVESTASQGSKSAEIGYGSPDWRVMNKEFPGHSVVTAQFSVMSTNEYARGLTVFLDGSIPYGAEAGPYINLGPSGYIRYFDGAWKDITGYVAGTWYTIKIVANCDTDTFDIYVDDMETPVMTGLGFRTPKTSLSLIAINNKGSTNSYIDDVLVLGYQYQCNLHTKELEMPAGDYLITVFGDGYEYQHSFMLFEGGKAKGKP